MTYDSYWDVCLFNEYDVTIANKEKIRNQTNKITMLMQRPCMMKRTGLKLFQMLFAEFIVT
uniref:Uncharacterized protein n=1 Tax=Romanomermis culicivorax TaxID=13658 RepID=A0A915HH44_ROMCU